MHLLNAIEKNFLEIDAWLRHQSSKYNAPVYVSADVRNNGFKVAPVDINLFPACFNNLSEQSRKQASINFKQFFQQQGIQSICLIPENYTRNLMYLQNVHSIMQILQNADLHCTVGHCSIDHDIEIEIGHGQHLYIKKMLEKAGYLQDSSGNKPDAILLNTDLISGPLVELSNVRQPIFPNADFGWHRRKKSSCFEVYKLLCTEFGANFNIDPWFLCPLFDSCNSLDFRTMSNIDKLAEKVEKVLMQIAIKNREYSVPYSPAVFIKADNGSHGMGIILATSSNDVAKINKKNRDKMAKVKHNSTVDSVIIQEALETIEFYEGAPAEYLSLAVGGNFVSAMMRHNSLRTSSNNLNQKGAAFLDRSEEFSVNPVYNVVSRLVALSSAIECSTT